MYSYPSSPHSLMISCLNCYADNEISRIKFSWLALNCASSSDSIFSLRFVVTNAPFPFWTTSRYNLLTISSKTVINAMVPNTTRREYARCLAPYIQMTMMPNINRLITTMCRLTLFCGGFFGKNFLNRADTMNQMDAKMVRPDRYVGVKY